ncbi:RNase adapter protein RapZ [hydrothermal vent metagenome]|uniref:RNase adapter protein RapZ n=1 Tax=hydrothermal vent metagenome TaxID=652676 RepID=A0A3B1AD56_9ZZZZ
MKLIIVSGLSGSGKSIALQALEDLGFNCIDNLPMGLVHSLAVQITHAADPVEKQFAVGIDARNLAQDLEQFPELIENLKAMNLDVKVIYLTANEQTLIKRFSETRRKHPLSSGETPLNEAIALENKYLIPISSSSDLTLDSSQTNVHQLRELVRQCVESDDQEGMSILIESFGFKHGIPNDANFIFDVRCITNPHWVPELRKFTGKDEDVINYLEKHDDVIQMRDDIFNFIHKWIPIFEKENRSYMTIAIGCTGGYHRSVYLSEKIGRSLQEFYPGVVIRHRELL